MNQEFAVEKEGVFTSSGRLEPSDPPNVNIEA